MIDVTCGIGGDLLAFSEAGLICAGVDLDPLRVEVARANLDALGLAGAVTVADATRVDVTPFDAAFADPARRTAARPHLRGRPVDAAVAVRRGAAAPRRLRQGRARASRTTWCPTASIGQYPYNRVLFDMEAFRAGYGAIHDPGDTVGRFYLLALLLFEKLLFFDPRSERGQWAIATVKGVLDELSAAQAS